MLKKKIQLKNYLHWRKGLLLLCMLLLRTGGLFWLLEAMKVFIFWVFRKVGSLIGNEATES